MLDSIVTFALASATKLGENLMALPVSFFGVTIADNTLKSNGQPETTHSAVPITTVTAGNIDDVQLAIDAFMLAVAGVIIGNPLTTDLVAERELVGTGPASSTLAQRENKWLARYSDDTTHQKFSVSIGTADLTKLPAHSEFLNLGTGVGAALKTAFEALVVSPDDASHSVTLDSVQFVGRNR